MQTQFFFENGKGREIWEGSLYMRKAVEWIIEEHV
jgi:hypothetical protein